MAGLNHPLENVRVIDLGRHQAGPRCAQVLARMGAEVIKIERLGGEETRYHGPWVRKQSSYWVQYNSGKKSLSIDLRKEEGKEVLRELVKVSDVVVQNFRPGTIEKMGFGYETLKELNPRIIMVNVSAYGQFGPYRDNIGYDPIGQTMSGITMVTGEEGMPPIRTGVPIIDRITALHAAIGTLAALHERETSGEGQSMDVCLADTGYSMTEIPITAYHGTKIPPRRGETTAPPSGIYPCKEGWVLISAGDQHHWHRVCNALGRPEWLEDPRFNTRPRAPGQRRVGEPGGQGATGGQDHGAGDSAFHGLRRGGGAGEHHPAGRGGPAPVGTPRDGGGARLPGGGDRGVWGLLAFLADAGEHREHAAGRGAQRGRAVGDAGLQRGADRAVPGGPRHLRGTLLRRNTRVNQYFRSSGSGNVGAGSISRPYRVRTIAKSSPAPRGESIEPSTDSGDPSLDKLRTSGVGD